ncbi:YxeA family protein [Curtanaerobium respiraculi]|uniref:YxeA family protein n=1 Tax=Curtanaerobium respiraculi TaxID=2949669 RepID=UPI0024B3407F|nr:YxeA family protein [Curtanaerobium respiraculi]
MAKRIMAIVLGALVVGALAGVFYLTNTDNASTWYVRVDDAVAQDKSKDDEELWEYTLDAYNENGEHRQLTFTASKRLRDGAYLKLGYMPVREVVSWEEIQPDEIP